MSGQDHGEDPESEVWSITRENIGGSTHMSGVAEMGTDCSAVEVGQCLRLTAARIVAESQRSDPQQAERLLMWQAMLDEEDLETLPLSCGKCVLAYAWTTLGHLRNDNHCRGRCTCSNNAPDNQTPACGNPLLPQHPGGGLPPNPNYNPQMDANYMREITSNVVDDGSSDYERCYATASDVTAQDISDCLWKAIARLLAETHESEEDRKEDPNFYRRY